MKRYLIIAIILVFIWEINTHALAGEVLSLAGTWKFRLDPQHVGRLQNWYEQRFSDDIKLPGTTDEAGYGTKTSGPAYGMLSRPYLYEGPAWYQTEITIPDTWRGKRVTLFLERCHWQTEVWVDDRYIGMRDSLCTPHEYDFGQSLAPGKHRLTICVDNTYKIDVGTRAHSVTDYTQTNWNGIVGRIELRATDPIWIDAVQVYPHLPEKKAEIKIAIRNITGKPAAGEIKAAARLAGEKEAGPVDQASARFEITGARQNITIALPISNIKPWDEFNPALYQLTLDLSAKTENRQFQDRQQTTFGMRAITTKGTQIVLNDRPIMLRGTLECCIFPLTGYPPTDVEAWKRHFEIARSYGLNHFRFHSWCPPEAAFTAADQTGFLLHVETPVWTTLGSKAAIDDFVRAEADRILTAYGNHPSFTMLCAGNEPNGSKMQEFLGKLVASWKAKDSRRIYTGSAGWPEIAENQYQVLFRMPGGGLRIHGRRFGNTNSSTDVDYSQYIKNFTAPLVAHELGQWLTYPDYGEIIKYAGVLKPRNLEGFREVMAQHGMLEQNRRFQSASGRFAWLLYKEDIETCLRTPGFGGFQLLSLQDFPGQGEALVGLIDSFWDTKHILTPEQMHRFCGPTVPLARFNKFIWNPEETFCARLSVAHYGPKPLPATVALWNIQDAAGREVASGSLAPVDLPTGNTTNLGVIQWPLESIKQAGAYKLTISLKGTPFANDWDFWVYPQQLEMPVADDVIVADSINEEASKALDAGKKILFISPGNADGRFSVPNNFLPVFWSFTWFPNQKATLGLLCDPNHPALIDFPTDFHGNWQWWEVANKSRAFILNGTAVDFLPIVQVIDDYHRNHKLGAIVEARVGQSKIILCGMDIQNDLDSRPVARQLRYSLLKYMSSPAFNPQYSIDPEMLQNLLGKPSGAAPARQ
jgi:hypothetical protein